MLAFLRKLWVFVRPYRFRLGLGLLCGCGFALTNLALTLVVKLVPDIVFSGDSVEATQDLLEKTGRFRELLEHFVPHWNAPTSHWGVIATILLIPGVMLFRGLFMRFWALLSGMRQLCFSNLNTK